MKREHKAIMKRRARNICLTVAYDGTAYHGFQRQTNGVVAVQNVLESALEKIFGDKIELTAAGRTDTGVHAAGQVVNFFTDGKIPVEKIPRATNAFLPPDIVVRRASQAPHNFSALHDARSKVYVYRILNDATADPLVCRYAWHVERKLDTTSMNNALKLLEGEHDFSAFRAAGGNDCSPIRTMYEVCLRELCLDTFVNAIFAGGDAAKIIEVKIHGDGFLYHMVRNIMGALVCVGAGRMTVTDFAAVFMTCDRTKAPPTAPAAGLCLQNVFY